MSQDEKQESLYEFTMHLYNSEAQRNLFQFVIQNLTFAPSISIYEMARTALKIELGQEVFDKKFDIMNDEYEDRLLVLLEEAIIKPYRRICQELKNFSTDDSDPNTHTNAIESAKIYDKDLQVKQYGIYNKIAQREGFSIAGAKGAKIFEKPPSFDVIMSALELDGAICKRKFVNRKGCSGCKMVRDCKMKETNLSPNLVEILSKYVPHFYLGDRNGVCFIEYIMIQGIYMAKWQRGLECIGDKSIYEIIDSTEMYKTYVDIFFMVFYEILWYKFKDIESEYIRQVQLPERYRKAKDVYKAFAKHKECQIQSIIDSGNWYVQNRAIELAYAIEDMVYLVNKVLPNVWETMIDECDKRKIKKRKVTIAEDIVDPYQKALIAHYYRVIKIYIDISIRKAKEIIKKYTEN